MSGMDHDKRVAFFLAHAGWSYPVGASTAEQALARLQGAEELARAEEIASSRGWYVETQWDHDDCSDPDDKETAQRLATGELIRVGVILKDIDTGRHLASLWGVIVENGSGDQVGDGYVRVVAAELAAELLATHQECHARTTCGNCGKAWCSVCDPAPSALCHWCHGRGESTAEMEPAYEEMTR